MARKTKSKALADRQKVEESKQKPLAKGAASPKVTVNPKKKGHEKENILKIKDGRVEKKKRPVSKRETEAKRLARKAMKTGETMSEDQRRKADQDRRTLYIRFKDADKLPKDLDEIKKVHKDISEVRAPRQAKKKKESTVSIRYAFIEFADEMEAEKAKAEITVKNFNVFVDYVGKKSMKGSSSAKKKSATATESTINPLRLVVSGVVSGLSETKLMQLFPKCHEAEIPMRSLRKGGVFGFVEFRSVALAKAAFDAAKDLKIDGNPATVRFAKMNLKRKRKGADAEEKSKTPEKKRKTAENDDDVGTVKVKAESDEGEDDDDDGSGSNSDVEEQKEGDDSEEEGEKEDEDEEDSDGDDDNVENDKESDGDSVGGEGGDGEEEEESDDDVENDEESDDDEGEEEDEEGSDR